MHKIKSDFMQEKDYSVPVFRMSIDIGGVTPPYNRSLSLQPSYAFYVKRQPQKTQ